MLEQIQIESKTDEHIPLIKPIKEAYEFENEEEFNTFYQEHKSEFEHLTTHKLNKMYHIPGFKITRIKNVISLKNIPESRITANMKIEELTVKIDKIMKHINKMSDTINKIIDTYQKGQKY